MGWCKKMKVLIIGQYNTVIDSIIQKLSKERIKIYVLTGGHDTHNKYRKVYEQYNFSYTNNCIKEVFESVQPDVTIFTGAFDSCYNWEHCYREMANFCAGLYNILTAFSLLHHGRFIYLSSDELYNITESEYHFITENSQRETDANVAKEHAYAYKANALKSGEDICNQYCQTTGLDILTLRIEGLCFIPRDLSEAWDSISRLCVEALNQQTLTLTHESYMPLYISDATEFLFKILKQKNLKQHFYRVHAESSITAEELAAQIDSSLGIETEHVNDLQEDYLWIETTNPVDFNKELSVPYFYNAASSVSAVTSGIGKNKNKFKGNQGSSQSTGSVKAAIWGIFNALLPFIENFICFIPFFMINNRVTGSNYFAKLDCYLLYVLLFAIIYGQQQAAFSAVLSVCGYFFRQMYNRTGFDVMLDYNTYVWIAQLMILGLSVGYIRDQLRSIKADKDDELSYLSNRLHDIEDINSINVRLKDELETQIINQSDSIGKIFEITSSLDRDEPESVFFHAAEVVSQLMNCRDVAIYNVSNRSYARLMSSTSANAGRLGNSIEYTALDDMYQSIKDGLVYVNKKLDKNYPMMATAIMSGDDIKSIIMLWDISWERMNLSQSNRLKVIGYLIQNAVIRADKYIDVLENERYIEGTNVLEPQAFRTLLNAFLEARKKGLADCLVIRITPDNDGLLETSRKLAKLFRNSDYMGILNDGYLYVLLANTSRNDSGFVTGRIREAGYEYVIPKQIEG
jgi:nucleoside-diphosphate-sugar epimerase